MNKQRDLKIAKKRCKGAKVTAVSSGLTPQLSYGTHPSRHKYAKLSTISIAPWLIPSARTFPRVFVVGQLNNGSSFSRRSFMQ